VGKPEGRKPIRKQDIGGWIIFRWILERWDLDRIGLAQDRNRWRALVNSVLNLRAP
jgi:hypothetical protein